MKSDMGDSNYVRIQHERVSVGLNKYTNMYVCGPEVSRLTYGKLSHIKKDSDYLESMSVYLFTSAAFRSNFSIGLIDK